LLFLNEVLVMAQTRNKDVIIIGAGPAGLTAAIYCAWLGLKTVVLETGIAGGRAYLAPKIENFPGFPEGIRGSELVERMNQQSQRFGAEFRTDEEVIGLDLKGDAKQVTTHTQTYQAPALVIATGTQRRKLRVPGETEFLGRGVSYCAICDGPFFRKLPVAIVGNGEEAAIDALALADLASSVTIVSQEQELVIEGALMERLKVKANVDIFKGKLIEIIGDQVVKAIKIQQYPTQQDFQREVKGVFVALGGVPLTAIVQNAGIITDRNGCLTVDRMQKTNVEGVFAAGDCTCGGMQVITAAGEGAMAAMKASAYIRRGKT
jgi:thioredoxin reductase (NADPH)